MTGWRRFWMTWLIIAVTVAVFLFVEHGYQPGAITAAKLAQWGGVVGWPYTSWRSLIFSTFLHVSWVHIGSNMVSLYVIGPWVELALGPWEYLVFYLLGGAAANLTTAWLQPANVVAVGASGAIFALIGYLAVRWTWGVGPPAPRARRWLWTMLALNLLLTVAVPHIAVWDHVGGLAFGFLWGTGEVIRGRRRF